MVGTKQIPRIRWFFATPVGWGFLSLIFCVSFGLFSTMDKREFISQNLS